MKLANDLIFPFLAPGPLCRLAARHPIDHRSGPYLVTVLMRGLLGPDRSAMAIAQSMPIVLDPHLPDLRAIRLFAREGSIPRMALAARPPRFRPRC
jgi:hypothetical protein